MPSMLGGILTRAFDLGLQKLETVRCATLGRFLDRDGWNIARLICLGTDPLGRFL